MGKRIRALYVIDKMTVGGTQTHLDTVIRNVSRHGVDPTLCCLQKRGKLAERLARDGYRVECLNLEGLLSVSGVFGIDRLRRVIRRGQFDVVHAYLFSANLITPIAAWLARVPVLTSRRDTGFWAAHRHIVAARIANRLTTAITVNSEAVKQATLLREHPGPRAVCLIPNGVLPRPAHNHGFRSVIGTVGNLTPVKGQAVLIRAFQIVGKQYPDLCLHLYGEGPERRRLECTVGAVGLNGQVRFQGRQPVSLALEAMDVFVLPSLSEGCSNALLEAMAAGLPVVAADIPANREVIRDGVDGLLVPPGDAAAMAAAIGALVASATDRAALGKAASAVVERYSVEKMLLRICEVYDGVLKEAVPARALIAVGGGG